MTTVPHNKPLAFTVMARRKPRAADQENECSLGGRQSQIYTISYLSL